jgi:hypothetical protein
MRALALPVLLLAGCTYPGFVSSRVIELTIPATNLTTIDCSSHNGAIVVHGDAAATDVALRAELSVRGYTQEEADKNLQLLSLGKDFADGKLKIYGQYDQYRLGNMSPCFAFTLKVPQQVALTLESHNGDIRADGTRGAVAFESHNGDIVATATTSQLDAETHNGLVRIDVASDEAQHGKLDGKITSHNGDVVVGLAEGIGTSLTASTHNGEITPPRQLQDAVVKKRSLRCRIGDGSGNLQISTHNGDVLIR